MYSSFQSNTISYFKDIAKCISNNPFWIAAWRRLYK